MRHTKYQGSRPGGFRQQHFFYVFTICKIVSEYDQEIPQSQSADSPMATHVKQCKKKVLAGNATLTHCIDTHGTVRKSQRKITAS